MVPTLFLFNTATSWPYPIHGCCCACKRAFSAAWAELPALVAQMPWQKMPLGWHSRDFPPEAPPAHLQQPQPGWTFTLGSLQSPRTVLGAVWSPVGIILYLVHYDFFLCCLQTCVLLSFLFSSQWITSFVHNLLPFSAQLREKNIEFLKLNSLRLRRGQQLNLPWPA